MQEEAKSVLNGTVRLHSNELNRSFAAIDSRLETIQYSLEVALSSEEAPTTAEEQQLTRLPEGNWRNPLSAPASIFVPDRGVLPDSMLAELDAAQRLELIAADTLSRDADVAAIYFGGSQGGMVHFPNTDLAASLPPAFDVTQEPWYLAAGPNANPDEQVVWSNLRQDPEGEGLVVTASVPVHDTNEQFRGVVAVDMQLARLSGLISSINVQQSGYAFLLDNQGRVIGMPERALADFGLAGLPAYQEDPLSQSVLRTASSKLVSALLRMTNGQSGLQEASVGTTQKYLAYGRIDPIGYSLGVAVPVAEMQERVLTTQLRLDAERRSTLITLIAGSVAALALALVAWFWLGTALTSPLIRLTRTARSIAQGDLNAEAVVDSGDEIGVMASTFNAMTKSLRDLINDLELRVAQRTAQLKREKDFSEALVHNSPGAIVSVDAQTQVIAWNPAAVTLFGYSESEAIGSNLDDLVARDEKIRAEALNFSSSGTAGGFHAITKRSRKDGSLVDVEVRGVPLALEDQMGVIAIYHDITELQQARTEAEAARDESLRLLKITEERAAELAAISKVSQALVQEAELESTIQLIGDQMQEIFKADIAYLALLDQQTKLIHFPYQVGETFTTLKLGEGYTGRILESGEPLLINSNIDRVSREIGVTRVGKHALSYLGVPIQSARGTIGALSVQSTTREGAFNDDSLRLLTTIAANAGAALHNAQLFSEALENLRQVEILTNAAGAIQQSAYEPEMVRSVAERPDALGELARVFRNMADEVRTREQRLKRQLAQLQLDIEEKQQAKAETVAVYIPMDRRQALAGGRTLPERAQGAALFADVSGFTTLTEALANELGRQRGAEEVIRQLNRVYSVLIDEVHRFGGSVINFSGDAITCWFDDLDPECQPRPGSSAHRALACALAMQAGMQQFAAINRPDGKIITLSIKVAVAAGPARRILVGVGTPHQIDVLAGSTLAHLAEAEHHAEKGEIIVATAGVADLDASCTLSETRDGGQFGVVAGLKTEVPPAAWPDLPADAIPPEQAQPWMLPAVFDKVRAAKSDMLSELRQAAALFLKFGGLQYDTDAKSGQRLDRYIQWVEQVIAPYEGSIIQLTVGDKGSYLYAVFGVPVAHPDAPARAVRAALELAKPPKRLSYITDIQIGLAYGQMRVGAYGGSSHRTYGAIGDRTNLAARLMQAANSDLEGLAPGQGVVILAGDAIHEAARAEIEFESLPPIRVKGKSQPIAVYRPLRPHPQAQQDSRKAPAAGAQHPARMDQLSPAEQLTLKVASVIGSTFTLEVLTALYPEEAERQDLPGHLQRLAELGLLAGGSADGQRWSFKDDPTHSAAYNFMLFAQRRQLHRALAELLEQTASGTPPYAEIAQHWQAAEELPKAVQFLEKAGEQARENGDLAAATGFFNLSLELDGQ
ncbi:MAG TPA: cache domain-containing protein [Anaerolineales bacterium]|nr:cache domain-containing protein [Anaerolineales bacterium]